MNKIKLPPLYEEYGGGIPDKELLEALNKGASIYLYGAVGTGKTWTAIQLAKHYKKPSLITYQHQHQHQQPSIEFHIYEELMQELLAKPEEKLQAIKKLFSNHLLIIDDFSLFSTTTARLENIYLIINGIYTRKKQVIITSNFSPEALKELDERSYDRLKQITFFKKLTKRMRKNFQ